MSGSSEQTHLGGCLILGAVYASQLLAHDVGGDFEVELGFSAFLAERDILSKSRLRLSLTDVLRHASLASRYGSAYGR